MKPVAVFRHSSGEGPGYFATFLEAHSVPWTLIKIDEGAAPPPAPDEFSGLCFMGGPMSVNDDLPWLTPTFALIRAAVERGIPVIGHCLGGQLMSKALGGAVTRNRVKELGWGEVETASPAATDWLGDMTKFEAFHWHGETFSIPPGATRILKSAHCDNQAFVLGPHLGMQCHVEMTESMIRLWCRHWADENAASGPSVQTPEQMDERMAERIPAMRAAADRLYTKWIAGLSKS
ncbi:type 1 glutamine amidotransferase [Sulfurisoma sediminicola]|uniref:GMP synthase-like glutamine amidotransferase n=1 Tax=Sulfurisoma sediminicola TaxID=1381557 RepID=A0A497X998_9PROT|nr:type 1 glutamine amidotransferase [Sulfurisoma sediminicola]RLJ62812.1 GMP synthase-like glutamine amidotransferase [Sulfurisoma sediminicola]